MAQGRIIQEIKNATDNGGKISQAMQNRLILAALVELYDVNHNLASALEAHVKESGFEMEKKLKEHECRIEKLERHDLIEFFITHPKLSVFLISAILTLGILARPLLASFGIILPDMP